MVEVVDLLGGYRVERSLGRGGMGIVYRARDERLQRWVALKLIAPELAREQNFRERFERECRLAAAVDHPNVIPIYEAGEADGRLFLAMRLVEGTDLHGLISYERCLAPKRALAIVAQIAAALDAAHANRLIHRDVKPANVLIVDAGAAEHVYLTDFGLARLAGEPSGLTTSGRWVGTPNYVAPEQLRGGPVDCRADVYALGCVFFEALTGRAPFAGAHPEVTLAAHLATPPPRLSDRIRDTAPGLDDVLARALTKDAEERFSTAGEFVAAAEAALDASSTPHVWKPVSNAAATETANDASPKSAPAPSPLPTPAGRTFGRERDMREVVSLLTDGGVRCLTLTGTGGVGKTRLALELARAVASSFRDGVRFVSLAAVSDPAQVTDGVAQQLGLRADAEDAATLLPRFLRSKQMLLVLDNFEHVVTAAPVVADIRSRCTQVTVLVTSREPLRLGGERVYRVDPLALPRRDDNVEEVRNAPACALFIDRARAQVPGFRVTRTDVEAVAQISRWLDGVPLALELAAARTSLLSTTELVGRLDHTLAALGEGPRDAPGRQQTLRATIDWSYELLDEEEKFAFAGLAVFAGGADLEAVETVTGATAGTLAALVAKNLVVRRQRGEAPTRLHLLETIREYATERLDEHADVSSLRARHSNYFVDLAERAQTGVRGRDQRAWGRRLDDDLENMRAAMAWSLRHGSSEHATRLSGALAVPVGWHWRRSRPREAKAWLEAAIAAADRLPRRVRARACLRLALVLWDLGELEPALRRCREAKRLYRAAGDTAGLAESLAATFYVESSVGDSQRAAAEAAEGLRLARAARDRWVIAFALCANFFDSGPDLARVKGLADEAITIAQDLGDHALQALVHSSIGFAALEEGDYEYAGQHTSEAVNIHRAALDDVGGLVICLVNLGLVMTLEGNNEQAEAVLRESLRSTFKHGFVRAAGEALMAMAALASRGSDHVRAARLCGADQHLNVEAPSHTGDELYAEVLESGRAVLGEAGWRREYEWGHGLDFEDAIAYALDDGEAVVGEGTASLPGS